MKDWKEGPPPGKEALYLVQIHWPSGAIQEVPIWFGKAGKVVRDVTNRVSIFNMPADAKLMKRHKLLWKRKKGAL